MGKADLAALVDRLLEVVDALSMRASHDDPFSDDIQEAADEVRTVAEILEREVG